MFFFSSKDLSAHLVNFSKIAPLLWSDPVDARRLRGESPSICRAPRDAILTDSKNFAFWGVKRGRIQTKTGTQKQGIKRLVEPPKTQYSAKNPPTGIPNFRCVQTPAKSSGWKETELQVARGSLAAARPSKLSTDVSFCRLLRSLF